MDPSTNEVERFSSFYKMERYNALTPVAREDIPSGAKVVTILEHLVRKYNGEDSRRIWLHVKSAFPAAPWVISADFGYTTNLGDGNNICWGRENESAGSR